MLKSIVQYFVDRLKEPSTWRGIIMVATAYGAVLSPPQATAIITLGLALAGGQAMVTPDSKK